MKQFVLYNLSGRAIPENAEISISGEPRSGNVLIIDSCEGSKGIANWYGSEELKSRRLKRAQETLTTEGRPSWAEPLKPKVPYS